MADRTRSRPPRHAPLRPTLAVRQAPNPRGEAQDLFTEGNLVIETDDEKQLFESELRFPEELLGDPGRFNQIVQALTNLAGSRKQKGQVPKLTGLYQKFGILPAAQETLNETFATLCALHDEGRDHIWSYYVRNLARPWWLTLAKNRVDLLIGNPPWLAYRYMSERMQKAFREYSQERGLWHGAKVATNQDLSGLFLVRAVERYLKDGGRFAFVMPGPVLDRRQFEGLRSGRYKRPDSGSPLAVAFDPAWDLRRLRPHIFVISSAVLFGKRSEESRPLPLEVTVWSGTVPKQNGSWEAVQSQLATNQGTIQLVDDKQASPWSSRFRQGATIVPRLLFFVTRQKAGPLGMTAGNSAVKSLKRSNDKKPWKELSALEGVVETEFIRPVLVGESIIPFRIVNAFEAVIPRDRDGLMDGQSDRLDAYEGLAAWWRRAEGVWDSHRSSEKLSLIQRVNYQKTLEQQFPIQRERIVYNKAGMHLVAARVSDHRAVIDHKLYWATANSQDEALYLCAILNAAKLTELVRPYMSYGKDERDIDKSIWQLPIPLYDPNDDMHRRLSIFGAEQEKAIAKLTIDPNRHFPAVRRDIRDFIAQSEAGQDVEALVEELLS